MAYEDERDPRFTITDVLVNLAGRSPASQARAAAEVLAALRIEGDLDRCETYWEQRGSRSGASLHPGVHSCADHVGHAGRHHCQGCRSWRTRGHVW